MLLTIVKFGFESVSSLANSVSNLQKCSKTRKLTGPPWRILFFGTDSFSLASLKSLCAKLHTGTLISDLAIVSKAGTAVKKFGEEENLICHDWPLQPKEIASKGCLNVHASILPRWRGASPIIHAIMNGDFETGVTVMRIHPHKFDVGEIVRQYRIPIGPNETSEDLQNRLAFHGAQLLMECIRDMPRCVEMAIPQPQEGVTYAPKINASMSEVDWSKLSALEVYNLHRALSSIFPLKTHWHGQSVKLISLELDKELKKIDNEMRSSSQSALSFLNDGFEGVPKTTKIKKSDTNAGNLEFCKITKIIKVKCCDGNNVIVRTIRVGKKTISAVDFFNGFMSKKSKEMWNFRST
ncbi:methionyl-tRNA formyltransferase, mitochondrial isoform X2 [Cimex lectularius]|uniref:methionyl-tRNA formyltransferase n=1 Tax=Cimex lectularius TaxID=79782 RepID=A0A8I6RG49_CIMLE|nr:methionyl-tRNA formyltransferase, mitochondrial isoform X2 [Cimex lectularius]